MVSKVIIQLVSNYFVAEEIKLDEEKVVMHRVRKDVLGNVKLEVKLETTLDVILNIIKLEDSKEQGRRYGHPVIDIVRELNRYMHPQIHYAGKTKEAIEKVFAQKLKDALGIDEK